MKVKQQSSDNSLGCDLNHEPVSSLIQLNADNINDTLAAYGVHELVRVHCSMLNGVSTSMTPQSLIVTVSLGVDPDTGVFSIALTTSCKQIEDNQYKCCSKMMLLLVEKK